MRAVKPFYGGAAAAPHAGREGGAAGAAAGEGGGRGRRVRAEGAGGGWRVGAHLVCFVCFVCGPKVDPLLHEAGEGGEVALYRCGEKVLRRLWAQSSALSASQEQGAGCVRVSGRLAGL
jgi:hypothetical protein